MVNLFILLKKSAAVTLEGRKTPGVNSFPVGLKKQVLVGVQSFFPKPPNRTEPNRERERLPASCLVNRGALRRTEIERPTILRANLVNILSKLRP